MNREFHRQVSPQIAWVHSSVVRAADCRSAGPWFKSGCALHLASRAAFAHSTVCHESLAGGLACELGPKICVLLLMHRNILQLVAPRSFLLLSSVGLVWDGSRLRFRAPAWLQSLRAATRDSLPRPTMGRGDGQPPRSQRESGGRSRTAPRKIRTGAAGCEAKLCWARKFGKCTRKLRTQYYIM